MTRVIALLATLAASASIGACTDAVPAGEVDGGTTTARAATTGASSGAATGRASGSASATGGGASNGSSTAGSTGTSGATGSTGTSSATGTTGTSGATGTTGTSGVPTGGATLFGTWDLLTTPLGSSASASVLVVAQDQITINSGSFTLTAQRSGNALHFDDQDGSDHSSLTGTQAAASFDAGLIPFDLGGTWTVQAGPATGNATLSCTLSVGQNEIDATCAQLAPASPWFSFTTTKDQVLINETSGFGDFSGLWSNHWTWAPDGGTYPCTVDFNGLSITTSATDAGGPDNGGNPLLGITFTFDGVNGASGTVQGWSEYSATRR